MFSTGFVPVILCASLFGETAPLPRSGEPPVFRTAVEMVSVTFSVIDANGRYVRGLKAADIKIFEDGTEQQLAAFSDASAAPVETSIFLLIEASNAMYGDFVRAFNTVSGFLRSFAGHGVAVYTYNRNLHRTAPLARDPWRQISISASTVLGDETAIFNSLLLTIRDAARVPGNKTVVLLSNGPDPASMVGPDDVARVAREEGIPVHIVFTEKSGPLLTAAFRRIAASTAGQAYPARTWQDQEAALNPIREELLNSYTVAYYPKPNDNDGFRRIRIDLVGDVARRYRVRARPGYKPALTHGTKMPIEELAGQSRQSASIRGFE
jgi:VWFA-related protein